MARYIFVAGGVMSGIGKGIATASIGKILQSKGFNVTAVKIDPYINVDAGTMNPTEHGEVFVTDDGVECDQDIGNYERFLNRSLTTDNYMTTGRVYQTVIEKERNLEYGGRCVEVVPDIPNEVIRRIKKAAKKDKADFVLVEIGGTVGEYQNLLFLEAARMMKLSNPRDVLFILVSYLPVPKIIGEMKTKPTQYAVRTLNSAGIQPDVIIARSEVAIDEPRKKKLSIFCNVLAEDIISAPDVKSIYEVPLNFEKDNLGKRILKKFDLEPRTSPAVGGAVRGKPKAKANMNDWRKLVNSIRNPRGKIKIGIVGKYFKTGKFTLMDSYISVIEAVKHAAWHFKKEPEIHWLDAEIYEGKPRALKELKEFKGIIVPGGFGNRGVKGKIRTIEYCRKNKIPFLGLCFGMQLAVIEFARNVCNIKDASSAEFVSGKKNKASFVIDVMPEQDALISEKHFGGTMRLGSYPCKLTKNSLAFGAYKPPKGKYIIFERHRHRYELNNDFRKVLEGHGMIMSGINPERDLVEIIEIPKHPFFVATQFHPEFKSRPLRPHPLFREFIKASINRT